MHQTIDTLGHILAIKLVEVIMSQVCNMFGKNGSEIRMVLVFTSTTKKALSYREGMTTPYSLGKYSCIGKWICKFSDLIR